MLDLQMNASTNALMTKVDLLPPAPSPSVSDKYQFIDTRKVVEDMRDLGFEVAGFRRPKYRTREGAFGLHEVDFRRPADIGRGEGVAPRVLFLNSYDGSRRAQIISGVIRFICLNGLIAGDIFENQKFLHLGDYEDELVAQIRASGDVAGKLFDRIEHYQGVTLERPQMLELARKAKALRFGDTPEGLDVDVETLIQPRRREDTKRDLWTAWNVLQENLLKGGVPGRDASGNIRTTRPLAQIQKSNDLNRGLWDLLETFAAA